MAPTVVKRRHLLFLTILILSIVVTSALLNFLSWPAPNLSFLKGVAPHKQTNTAVGATLDSGHQVQMTEHVTWYQVSLSQQELKEICKKELRFKKEAPVGAENGYAFFGDGYVVLLTPDKEKPSMTEVTLMRRMPNNFYERFLWAFPVNAP